MLRSGIRIATAALCSVRVACALAGAAPGAGGEAIPVVPKPAKIALGPGSYAVTSRTAVWTDSETRPTAEYLAELLAPATGMELPVKTPPRGQRASGGIVLGIDPALRRLGDEGYVLRCTATGVTVTAPGRAGVFYGVQTLRQLLPVEIESGKRARDVAWTVPCVAIEDGPRFGWRGMMLDPGRHFLPKDFVKKYIDVLALHKLNRLHLHLTDDQGWRIEIKRYPRLAEVSAWRGRDNYGGFYSREDIGEIVAHAASRHVTVIPEIEMPGHAQAALAAFPEISCTGGPFNVSTRWGVHSDVYCAGNEKTFEFLENVISEVVELFPAPYIHIGGDECRKGRWQKCPKCQARRKKEGLKDEHELQSYFIKRMEKFVNSRGKRIIGWDEILEGGLAPDATVQSWRGTKGGVRAARARHDVIMSPTSHCYFDYYQGPRSTEPRAIGGFIPLEKVYSFEPVPRELTPEEARHVLGLQGNVWGEYIATGDHVEYMSFPRGSALAEVGWTPRERRDVDDFRERLGSLNRRLDLLGVNYRKTGDRRRVGGWKPADLSEAWKPLSWDLTGRLKGSGTYEITLQYTGGAHRLDVQWAALVEDGTEIARDAHHGITGARHTDNVYVLELKEHKPGARYELRASVRSDGGTDSNGGVWLSRK